MTAASLVEYRTTIDLGALPTIAVGLAEESCKLIVPLGNPPLGLANGSVEVREHLSSDERGRDGRRVALLGGVERDAAS